MVTKELVERFFRNECTPEEQEQVLAYFKVHPEELAEYFDEKEWEGFAPFEKMNPELSERLFENIHRQTSRKKNIVGLIRRLSIAASVLLVVSLSWMYLGKDKQEVKVAKAESKTKDSLMFVARHEVNYSGKEKEIKLEDGTLIVLANNSEIAYQLPFVNSRSIVLNGKAYFKVAKDKTKPFTVTSGDISTTAVGTEFTVTAFKNKHQIIVRLYEGKVVVKASNTLNNRMKSDVYLLPGQQFIYGDQTTVKVKSFKATVTAPERTMREELASDNPSIPENIERPYFMFNNQSLNTVLDDLAAMYNVKIIYSKQDVQNAYFTGKYDRSESLETILNRIATLNNLSISKKDSAYVISH